MNNFYEILKRLYTHAIFLFLLGISLSLYFNTTYYQKAQIGSLTKSLSGFWHNHTSFFTELLSLRQTNMQLALENIKLRNQMEAYRLRLRELQDSGRSFLDSAHINHYILARVIDNSINTRKNFLTIDVGSRNGVYKGMGVITQNGVVGIVASTSPNYSSVISLLNTDIKVSVKHKKSGSFGAISWDGTSYRKVTLDEIPLHCNVSEGDTILTSGFSTIFPKDIPIGRVVDFYNKDGSFLSITVELFADFKTLDYVYLVDSKGINEIHQIQTENR